jgi:hypothetical protein
MGLDIYLYTREQAEQNERYEVASDVFYSREDWPSEEERKAARDALPQYVSQTKVPSERYPDHLFNRRYLRSSYNNSGFEGAVPEMTGEDHGLYWIFEPVRSGDEYETELTADSVPALEQAKARALQVAEEVRACDPLRTTTVSSHIGRAEHMWHEPPTEEQVLAWYRDERKRNADRNDAFGDSYSNAKGAVFGFTEGMEVLATTVGRDILGWPSVVLVFRLGKEAHESYVQSAEIIAEFCDEAIALIRKDGSCLMCWSG